MNRQDLTEGAVLIAAIVAMGFGIARGEVSNLVAGAGLLGVKGITGREKKVETSATETKTTP